MLRFIFSTFIEVSVIIPLWLSIWAKHFLFASFFICSEKLITLHLDYSITHPKIRIIIKSLFIIFIWNGN